MIKQFTMITDVPSSGATDHTIPAAEVTTLADTKANSVFMRNALVTPDNWRGMEEWYISVIECPKCQQKLPAKHTNYCSGCGVKLKMSTTVQKYANSAW